MLYCFFLHGIGLFTNTPDQGRQQYYNECNYTLVFLQKVIKKTTDKIRDLARKSIRTIKTIRGQPATREQIEQAVREANEERCKRNEAREKRRLEASNNNVNNGKRNEQKSWRERREKQYNTFDFPHTTI